MQAMRDKLFKSNDEEEKANENDITLEDHFGFEIGDSEDEIKLNF